MKLKRLILFIFFLIVGISTHAQDAISFDSLQFGHSILTNDAIYINTNKFVKSDYRGNVIWAKSGIPANSAFKIKDDHIYIFQNDGITKMDSSGNVLWSKNFPQPVCSTSTAPNRIADVVINADRIYVLSNQNNPGGISYPSVITLDTGGVVLNSWCGNNQQNTTLVMGIEKTGGGAWLSAHDGGNVHTGLSIPIDNDGNLIPGIDINFYQLGQFNFSQLIIKKSNNIHCYFVNSFTPGYAAYPYLIFESDVGNTFSHNGFNTPTLSLGMDIITACIDHNDNFYIIGTGYSGEIIFYKTDPFGNVLISSGWSASVLNTYNLEFPNPGFQTNMFFRQDSVYITCKIDNKLSIISFDTLLTSTCFATDLSIQIDNTSSISLGNYYSITESPLSFTGTNASLSTQNISQSNGSKVCRMTSVPKFNPETQVEVYPNPAIDELNIRCEHANIQIELFSISGQRMQVSPKKIVEGVKLDLAEFESGMYILSIIIKDTVHRRTIIIGR